jgi:hypothetical protein
MTDQAPIIQYDIQVTCAVCGKEVASISTTSEIEAKEGFAKAITVAELHDCRKAGKGP